MPARQGRVVTRVRCVTEMGMGVDVHGGDATKAACRAVSDAIRHSSLGFFRLLGKTAHDMHVDVTIGVPHPETVDIAVVAAELPYGTVTVTAILGGLEIPGTDGVDAILIETCFDVLQAKCVAITAIAITRTPSPAAM